MKYDLLSSITNAINLVQMVDKPTRRDGTKSSTLIVHIFTNCGNLCSKSLLIPVGCSDHNLVVLVQKAKVLKAGPKAIIRRSVRDFYELSFIDKYLGNVYYMRIIQLWKCF